MQRSRQFLVLIFAALLIVTVACSGTAAGGAANSLTLEQLKNTIYFLKDAPKGQITLQNGKGDEPIAPNSASRYTATLVEPAAFGSLNNDSAQDAADVVVTSGGGSGSFYNLAAVLNENGLAKNVAAILLGDRIKVTSLKIENGAITIEYLAHGPNDPMAAEPTQKMVKTYQLQGNQLVEVP